MPGHHPHKTQPSQPVISPHARRAALLARKAELAAQIAAYPAPITACDAQFNGLLEEEAQLRAELRTLEEG